MGVHFMGIIIWYPPWTVMFILIKAVIHGIFTQRMCILLWFMASMINRMVIQPLFVVKALTCAALNTRRRVGPWLTRKWCKSQQPLILTVAYTPLFVSVLTPQPRHVPGESPGCQLAAWERKEKKKKKKKVCTWRKCGVTKQEPSVFN